MMIAALVLMCSAGSLDMSAKRSKSKAKTTQVAKKSRSGKGKKSKSSKNKGNKNNKKSKKSGKSKKTKKSRSKNRKNGKNRRNNKKRTYKPRFTYTPPKAETPQNDSLTLFVNSRVLASLPEEISQPGLRVNSVKPDSRMRTVRVGLNENFTYLPVTQELISSLQNQVSKALPDSLSDYKVNLQVGQRPMTYFINRIDKLPEQYRKNPPFVKALDGEVSASRGMENDIVALWASHGWYYRPGSGAWMWQRGSLFETIEDIYTMGYILPYTVPMLENAGAYVFLPRERDINRNEVIVDNDTNDGGEIYSQSYYRELTGKQGWSTGEDDGFIYDLKDFRDTENPFENGTYRMSTTVKKGDKPSMAAWYADIPEAGEYAVYVSYKTLPNSSKDALYTVNYSGGSKSFTVNQTMGGGTWIYLGTFPLEAGYSDVEPVVTLSNVSSEAGMVVTADAVKIGGGMGNIARSPRRSDVYFDPSTPENDLSDAGDEESADDDESADDEDDDEEEEGNAENEGEGDVDKELPVENAPQDASTTSSRRMPSFRTSGYPRYLEGARYWLHWAGFPESVYSPYHGSDDYKDDYTSRGHWVNYLAGGSRVLPGRDGLNLPVDVCLALHSDAGKRADDSYVGTLGIFFTQGGINYQDGTPRINSRMLTDLVMRQITGDIRKTVEPRWTRRSMWDKSYVEARVPEVPTTLIELLSHQNFGDMKYGLDPNFRFIVGRAIYKSLARFIGERKGREVVIQPLPVEDFAIVRTGNFKYRLSWHPREDKLEPTAKPAYYIIYERTEGVRGFRKIGQTSRNHFDVKIADHKIHSFKIVAANDGGNSFPSEILALREGEGKERPALIINGFSRVAAPGWYSADGCAGFNSTDDFGVPYIRDISFSGHQMEYRRSAGESFGKSSRNYESKVIAGNTFDYPSLHGASLAAKGYGFVSASAGAVESGSVKLGDYRLIDLILGKQKATRIGNGHSGVLYRAIPEKLQGLLDIYIRKGGKLIVSGQYVASDLNGADSNDADRRFCREVLGIEPGENYKPRPARIEVSAAGSSSGMTYSAYEYNDTLNDKIYIVEYPDNIVPASDDTKIVMTFSGSDAGAAALHKYGKGEVVTFTIPIETVIGDENRDRIVAAAVEVLGVELRTR